MRNPRSPWQPEFDAAASRVCRAILIYVVLTVLLYASAFAQSGITARGTGIPGKGQGSALSHNGMLMNEPMASALRGFSGGKTITLAMPAGAQADTLKVVLNGKDVSDRFNATSCDGAVCAMGTVSSSDGIRPGKNVLYAFANSEGGKVVSSRLRFEGDSSSGSSLVSRSSFHAEAVSYSSSPALPTLSSFLPPAVALSTNPLQLGYIDGKPWITVGSQQQYPDASLTCGTQPYSVVVLDRATLQESTPSQCFASDLTLTPYLQKMTSSDLVIVATNYNIHTDRVNNKLDTSAIGGTNYGAWPDPATNPAYPINYLAIGVGGATHGQAYESYLTSQKSVLYPPFAKGTFVEDVNGNYNFVSSDVLEFQVAPNDTTYGSSGWIRVDVPPAYVRDGYTTNLLLPPPTGDVGGYWLVILDRTSLHNLDSDCTLTIPYKGAPSNYAGYTNCGTFYGTGTGTNGNGYSHAATQAYLNLAAALNNLHPDQMAILTTIGNAAFGGPIISPYWVAFTNDGDWSFPENDADTAYLGTINNRPHDGFFQALTNLGIPPYATMNLINGPNGSLSAFSAVTAQGLGNPLTGSSAVSTTAYSQQGQTGYMHGVLTRDRFGYFRPGRTSQEQSFATDHANFQMIELTSLQPSDWPEFTTLLSTVPGGSVTGQTQAYRYASYLLISNYYLRNTQGHQDDLHFFFDGSLNTLIDYRVFDPANLTVSATDCSTSGDQITCNFPGAPGLPPATFSQADFTNVKTQLSAEVVDLTNVLTYLSTGSDNLKDVIAAGQSNTALAMIGAAATIQASSLAPQPTAPVQVNPSNVLSLVGSVVGVVGSIVAPGAGEIVGAAIGAISDGLFIASSVTGGLNQDPNSIPNPDFAFQTTLGQLANNQLLQGQMSVGFDTMADLILSDRNKLSRLGQLVTNTANSGFYMPNEVSQNATLNLINQGTQRSLMLSLLPSMYQVHYWPGVGGYSGNNFLPLMGYAELNTTTKNWSCHHFYANSPTSAFQAFPSPTIETYSPFNGTNYNALGFADQYILSLPMTSKGTKSASAQLSDDALNQELFGSAQGQLNFPFELMVMPGGAMDTPPLGQSSLIHMDTFAGSGFQNSSICLASSGDQNPPAPGPFGLNPGAGGSCPVEWPIEGGACTEPGTQVLKNSPNPSPIPISTVTTLTVPAMGVVGDNVTLSAKVTSASGAIPNGAVLFYQDDQNIGQGTLDATGAATFLTGSLPLGSYTFNASYVATQTYDTSTSNSVPVTIYQAPPGMTLSLSGETLTVSYGSTSTPVTLQVNSVYGMTGSVTFSCTGLPIGMTCNFNPAQASIAAGASATTALTISAPAAQAAGMPWFRGIGTLLLFLLSLLCLWRIRGGAGRVQAFVCLLLLSVVSVAYLIGCGSSSSTKSQPLQETGSKTVLVNATSGSFTQSVPVVLTIQ